ncbi:Lysophospholipid acyltransferase 2 [Fasciola hepatica]|uniref:Lysophospholipid acyltransferase 2 n=1 Tax=Fasciola hepatica TaxID=6192 RepID=A0A2H1CKH9_FASHE|nr:Lysophospholipid acyltransferase 2 [Fasciola hepatica]
MISWAYFSEVFMGVDAPLDNYKQRVRGGFYRGSQLFNPLAQFMNVPLDQINYVICGLVSFVLGQLMRGRLGPGKIIPHKRALVETFFGILILSFCFGNQIRVLLLQSTVAYTMLLCLPQSRLTAILVTVWSMFYMTLVHLCRKQYDYGGYTLDISGPVMVQTQRLSSLAFNLADGARIRRLRQAKRDQQEDHVPLTKGDSSTTDPNLDDPGWPFSRQSLKTMMTRRLQYMADARAHCSAELRSYLNRIRARAPASLRAESVMDKADELSRIPPSHTAHAVDQLPGPVMFFAYTLYFHGVCVGPFVFYTEYLDYLRGYEKSEVPPIVWHSLIRLAVRTLMCGLLSAYLTPYFPFEFVLDKTFQAWPLLSQFLYSTLALFLVRQKYYFAWGLAEINGIGVGLGYTGVCPKTGQPIYAHVRSFDMVQVEAGLSLKHVIDSWNISTTRWLREAFYDRLPRSCRTPLVFIISAFWHGFYPGYYQMFLTFALFTIVSRMWHRTMRPYCRPNRACAQVYDLFTIFITNVAINYAQAPFHLLDWSASLKFWSVFYFVPHAIAISLLLIRFVQPRLARSVRARHLNHFVPVICHSRSVGG